MIKVIMMCGICGSGKTTYAKQKEKEGYVRLSIDEERGLIIQTNSMRNFQK